MMVFHLRRDGFHSRVIDWPIAFEGMVFFQYCRVSTICGMGMACCPSLRHDMSKCKRVLFVQTDRRRRRQEDSPIKRRKLPSMISHSCGFWEAKVLTSSRAFKSSCMWLAFLVPFRMTVLP